MTKEQWEFITAHWGTSDEAIMENIAQIKDADEKATAALEQKVADRDGQILELTKQNVDLNKTNMNLILRLTDPAIPTSAKEEVEEKIPSLNDLDAFIKP